VQLEEGHEVSRSRSLATASRPEDARWRSSRYWRAADERQALGTNGMMTKTGRFYSDERESLRGLGTMTPASVSNRVEKSLALA
jgi:hypothetical protein